MPTPLIKTLNNQGGTLYTFASATKDITKSFQNDGVTFAFSKYACIKIPNIKTPVSRMNNIQFDTIDGAIFSSTNLSDHNLSLSESFQNYVLNFEELILQNSNYDHTIKQSVAERMFFKWLKELGGIRFRTATSFESITNKFIEEDNSTSGSTTYERVVKHIGDLKVVNSVKRAGDVYSQLYINIPTNEGLTPKILFSSVSDANYYPSMVATGSNEYDSGRSSSTVQPAGLSVFAFYDSDDLIVTRTGSNEEWMGNSPILNSYYTEPTQFTDPSSVDILKVRSDYGLSGSNVYYTRTTLDGICIDWNLTDYTDIVNSSNNTTTLSEYNRLGTSDDFEFNAILIYYDLYDTSNPNNRATNLYGILFLDTITTTVSDGGFIKPFVKLKFNPVTQLNGNSYGLKLNIKFDSSMENAAIETVINDYESYSLSLFSDALNELKQSTQTLVESKMLMIQNIDKINAVSNYPYNTNQIQSLNSRISNLETSFANANLLVDGMQSIVDSISNVSKMVSDILNNNTPLTVSLSSQNVLPGNGIGIDIANTGKITINNKVQKYNYISSAPIDFTYSNLNEIQLKPYTNLFVENTTIGFTALNDIVINIDDTLNKWKTGQVYEFSFPYTYDLNGFNIIIKTDKQDVFKNGVSYGMLIAQITPSNFTSNSKYQIICIDEFNYIFRIEKIF